MRDRSIVPTNILNWPRCRALMPEQKLILIYLWASPDISCAGAGLIPLAPTAATLGFSAAALETGLENLRDAGLLSIDKETGEVFIKDWFRFHTFKNEKALQILDSAIKKIESGIIKRAVSMEKNKLINSAEDVTNTPKLPKKSSIKENSTKSITYLPTTTSTATSTSNNKQPLGSSLKNLGVSNELTVQVLMHASEHQQTLLYDLLQKPPPSFKKDSASWAAGSCRLAINGQLQ